MLTGLPGALDLGLPRLRAVADFPESHLVGKGQTKDTIRVMGSASEGSTL